MTKMAYCACGFRTRDGRDWHEHIVGANHDYHYIVTRAKRKHFWFRPYAEADVLHCSYCTASTFDPNISDAEVEYGNAPRCWEDKL